MLSWRNNGSKDGKHLTAMTWALVQFSYGSNCTWPFLLMKFDTGKRRDRERDAVRVLLVGCLKSQQYASVPLGQICSNNCTCCYTKTEVADQTPLWPSHCTDTRPAISCTYPKTPGTLQGTTAIPISSNWYDSTWNKVHRNHGLNLELPPLRKMSTTRPEEKHTHTHTHTHTERHRVKQRQRGEGTKGETEREIESIYCYQ